MYHVHWSVCMRSRSWCHCAIVTRAVCRHGRSRSVQLSLIGMAMSMVLTACHSGRIDPAQPLVPQDPLDQIAVQVMGAGTSTLCAKTSLLIARQWRPVYGCAATISDTTLYYYQDYDPLREWTGPIIIASRIWTASPGTAISTDEALRTQFNHVYGTSRDCSAPKYKGRYRQWHSSSFMVLLEEERATKATGPWTGKSDFFLLYIKAPVSCSFWDAFRPGPRPILERENPSQ